MSNKLSSRVKAANLLSVPQSPNRAGFVETTVEDPTAWPIVDGVRQKDGWVYLDGSTLDNSSGKYNDFVSANGGSTELPNNPYSSISENNWVDNRASSSLREFADTFTDLEIGKSYRVKFDGIYFSAGSSNWTLNLAGASGSVVMGEMDSSGATPSRSAHFEFDFVAATTSLSMSITVDNTNCGFRNRGTINGVANATMLYSLEELNSVDDSDIVSSYNIAKLFSDSGSVSISTSDLQVSNDASVAGDLSVGGEITDGSAALGTVVEYVEDSIGQTITTTQTQVGTISVTLTEGIWIVDAKVYARITAASSITTVRVGMASDGTAITNTYAIGAVGLDSSNGDRQWTYNESHTLVVAKGTTQTLTLLCDKNNNNASVDIISVLTGGFPANEQGRAYIKATKIGFVE